MRLGEVVRCWVVEFGWGSERNGEIIFFLNNKISYLVPLGDSASIGLDLSMLLSGEVSRPSDASDFASIFMDLLGSPPPPEPSSLSILFFFIISMAF